MTIASTNVSPNDTAPDVEERVLKVIALTKRLPRESVTPDSSFESLGIDSLDRLNILFDLESEFDIEINDEDAKRVENIPQMVAGVLALVQAKHHGSAGASVDPPSVDLGGAAPVAAHSAAPTPDPQTLPDVPTTKPASSEE